MDRQRFLFFGKSEFIFSSEIIMNTSNSFDAAI
jgi:hypothetical protein